MSLFRYSDYYAESKKNKVVSPRRASHGGVKTSKQVRLPTQYKSKVKYCRNCYCKNKSTNVICTQCDVSLKYASKRKLR